MRSVLDEWKFIIREQRPYSQKELQTVHTRLHRMLRIGKLQIKHQKCGHVYYCKAGGKKEKEAQESNGENIGNCSVCWKFRKTPNSLKSIATCLITFYNSDTFNPLKSYFDYDVEYRFYTWLYNEFT